MSSADKIRSLIETYELRKHPEGGWFHQDWEGKTKVKILTPDRGGEVLSNGSSIIYLVDKPNFICWHRLKNDEMYYWHCGGTLKINLLDQKGQLTTMVLGDSLINSMHKYEAIVPGNTWTSGELTDDSDFVCFSNSVFPAFDYKDWELGTTKILLPQFSHHEDIIRRLTFE